MKIHVRFFASLRERLRRSDLEMNLPDGATVSSLWEALRRQFPELERVGASTTFAVNREYVDRSHPLRDRDEVALIPPVSGGAPIFHIGPGRIDLAALVAAVADPAAGAVATFLGVTRDNNDGRRVTLLEYEAYPEMAVREMERIGVSARERWKIIAIAMAHRVGIVPIGEASVGIAVSAAHRKPAFEACHFAIDRLKEVVPVWKKEHFEGGEIWIGSQAGERFSNGGR